MEGVAHSAPRWYPRAETAAPSADVLGRALVSKVWSGSAVESAGAMSYLRLSKPLVMAPERAREGIERASHAEDSQLDSRAEATVSSPMGLGRAPVSRAWSHSAVEAAATRPHLSPPRP